MTEEEILIAENNILLAKFVGIIDETNSLGEWYAENPHELLFHESWDVLIERVIKRWMSIRKNEEFLEEKFIDIEYTFLTNAINEKLTKSFYITDVYNQMVENVKWYNKTKNAWERFKSIRSLI